MENNVLKTRFNKYVAKKFDFSRREADRLIEQGKIMLNGQIVTNPAEQVDDRDLIELDFDEAAYKNKKTYIMLNKPRGYVCSTNRDEGIPLRELVKELDKKISPVGRLDKDSSGLILLSDDGTFTTKVIGENSNVQKEYYVKVHGLITDGALEKLKEGVTLWNEKTRPTVIRRLGRNEFMITITEGKNRQIRRICQKVGYPVIELIRVRIGDVHLEQLELGAWRHLSVNEIKSLGE